MLQQQSYTGRRVIPSDLADTPCTNLRIIGVLDKFNVALSTSYTLDRSPVLKSFLESCIENNYDFRTAYAHFHPTSHLYNIAYELGEHEVKHTKDRGMREEVLCDHRISMREVPPQHVWDLRANRVVPYWLVDNKPWGISHAWVDEKDCKEVWTPINGYEWPVPMPKDADLKLIRIEMLNEGADYAWLDVLCLRQKYDVREEHLEEDHHRDNLHVEEWKLDVPTIGYVYECSPCVVYYLNGLGQPLSVTPRYFKSDRCWFNRAWTLQETGGIIFIGGDTGDDRLRARFYEKLKLLQDMHPCYSVGKLLSEMQKWVSTYPVDRVAGLVYCLRSSYIPIYDAEQSEECAWVELMNAMEYSSSRPLLFCHPEPGSGSKF
ncbi:uncharacterized protein EV420DRAFT_1277191 [Desarmillaria tabescens]|uniref:Heterokaryon incompatibility domain-containing protein n=1 Tax=Armillaria tabescens TaxID=1929756 RepID=A0AA39MTC1_ARMTA|nr:uncharacterized protein EV420DRAFT_1277191 [Desarmillaria tabescens]KAK0445055.1 hypothetical protein EV420DRAFT_1277191 [Desarmillaria tabescens]